MGKRSRDKGKKKRRDKRRRPDDENERANGGPSAEPVAATELAARLASLSTVLQRQLARTEHDDGLSRARLSALALLVLGGPKRLGELAAAEGVRPPTMTRLIDAMEGDGYVERQPDASDGRAVIIAATPAGEGLLSAGRARQIAPLADAIERLDGDEAAQLASSSEVLARLLRSVERPPGRG